MRSALDLVLIEGSNQGESFHTWIVALSFLGLGLLVGWVHGYHTAKHESSKRILPGNKDVE
jgi:hypothetical protein